MCHDPPCPLAAAGLTCPAAARRHPPFCAWAHTPDTKVGRFVWATARGERAMPKPPRRDVWGPLTMVAACDYRVLISPEEMEGCGCTARCLLGKGNADGTVALTTCMECVSL